MNEYEFAILRCQTSDAYNALLARPHTTKPTRWLEGTQREFYRLMGYGMLVVTILIIAFCG